jgi:D-aminopeptidase
LAVNGIGVGRKLDVPLPGADTPAGSIIVLVATDAPLLPHQCARVAQRAALGIARTGGAGENSSGDLILAWSTGNELSDEATQNVTVLANDGLDELFYAAIEATEEAIVNALLAARTMTGRDGVTVHGLDPDQLVEALAR